MGVDPCTVCGGTDLNLVDGFYYCVECGTQDMNAQETIIEQTILADGTYARSRSKKFKVLKDGVEMSGEWYKWHTFNFILCGLADELVELGARPSFKTKVLWVWALYVKQYQVNEDACETSALSDKEETNKTKASINESQEQIENLEEDNAKSKKDNIRAITKSVILGILYVALNLDQSDLQMSHLLRYVKEERLSIYSCNKFIPKELNIHSVPQWKCFVRGTIKCSAHHVQLLAMSIFKILEIGTPIVPDIRKIVDNYVKELSLPQDFKNLVFSLMNLAPCDFLDVKCTKLVVRIPDYEGVIMSYILVALKMCFGLDDEYEIKLSNVVDKINEKECYMKSHKLGMISEPTDRLFSFREWCNYLQFRKTTLCKYYLPMAKQHNLEVDDHVFMEQSSERSKRKIELSDEITMDILNKMPLITNTQIIPKTKFQPTLTPISTYTEVIIEYVDDPELKLLISEDFTQYSLKYACENLKLLTQQESIVTGVSIANKTVNPSVVGTLVHKPSDLSMVYVRNCENKNWIKTKRPTQEHITTIEEDYNESDRNSDHVENTTTELESTTTEKTEANIQEDIKTETELETIREEDTDKPIFDDLFDDVLDDKKEEMEAETEVNSFELNHESNEDFQDKDINDSKSDTCNLSLASFNPATFNRDKAIQELILEACQKYKIPIPREYDPKEPVKRKQPLVHIGAGQSEVKKRKISKRLKPGEAKKALNRIFAAYYSNLEQDVLHKVSGHVNSVLQNLHIEEYELEEELESKSSFSLNDSKICDRHENNEHNANPADVSAENANVIVAENNVIDNDSDEDDLLPKVNPKFDSKTYDARQLYIKFKEQFNSNDILDFENPDLENLIDRKIKESTKNKFKQLLAEGLKEVKKRNNFESDSKVDIPSTEVLQKKEHLIEGMKNLESLIKSPDDVKDFKYWLRHYTTRLVTKSKEMQQKFDLELEENCPSSFNFVIHECAAILDCTAYILYKSMANIERMLILNATKQ